MEDPEASLAIANRHFDNGDIKVSGNNMLKIFVLKRI